jgi:hypothetical protein
MFTRLSMSAFLQTVFAADVPPAKGQVLYEQPLVWVQSKISKTSNCNAIFDRHKWGRKIFTTLINTKKRISHLSGTSLYRILDDVEHAHNYNVFWG